MNRHMTTDLFSTGAASVLHRCLTRTAVVIGLVIAILNAGSVLADGSTAVDGEEQERFDWREKVQLHGFGGWAFGITDGNRYLIGDESGNGENGELALNVTVKPADKLRLVSQLRLLRRSRGGEISEQAEFDYAFLEWSFSDVARLRVGRTKHAFGIYASILDVGTLRPLYLVPQSIYGAQGFTAKSVNSVSLTGEVDVGRKWRFSYDVYGGQLDGELETPVFLDSSAPDRLQGFRDDKFEVDDVIGMRVSFAPQAELASLGLSAYRSYDSSETKVIAIHFNRETDRSLVRAEAARQENDQWTQDGAYAEFAYRLNQRWQLAVRYEIWHKDLNVTFPLALSFLEQFVNHEDLTMGVSYWFKPSLVLKLNYHFVTNNRFALPDPDELLQTLVTDSLDKRTDLLLLGLQFSF